MADKDYIIETAATVDDLEKKVNARLANGYVVQGGVAIAVVSSPMGGASSLAQAMISNDCAAVLVARGER